MYRDSAENLKTSAAAWFQTPFGRYLLASERTMLSQHLGSVRGYHLMQLSGVGRPLIEHDFDHSHHFSMVVDADDTGTSASAVTDFEALPLPSDTVDTALLHHALEFSENPHQVLNEVARVVLPGGHLVLVVFNPYSLWGGCKLLARHISGSAIWQHHNLRYGRLLDWLKLLNFQPLKSLRGCHQLPVQWQHWLEKTRCLQRLDGGALRLAGSYYLIVARKQVAPLTPVGKPLWQPLRNPLVPGAKKTACHHLIEQVEQI